MSLKLAISCCLVLAGCGGHGAGADASDLNADGGGICADLTGQTSDFLAAHQSCNVDSDCTGQPAFGFIYDMGSDVSCWPPVALSADAVSGFRSLLDQMLAAKCTGPTRVCSAFAPSGSCIQHVCTAT